MTHAPVPVVFEPILQPRPWGGRRLAAYFGRPLPPHVAIGESWELSGLPGNTSRVRHGPLHGRSLPELVGVWGTRLLGSAARPDGAFPLLIKFLDAQQPLSVQVHPPAPHPHRKDEAWYVIAAEPDAELLIGLRDGATRADLTAAAGRRPCVDLLRRWPATPGRCYLLPGGTPHALGGGVLVAEVQTPSDVTYRLYDWDRRDAAGRARELHIEQALASARDDVTTAMIAGEPAASAFDPSEPRPLIRCADFAIDRRRLLGDRSDPVAGSEMLIWIVLAGRGVLRGPAAELRYDRGDVVLVPAARDGLVAAPAEPSEILEVRAAP